MNEFMKIAIEEAQKGIHAGHGGPFGAVIVKDGKIVGKGHNMVVAEKDATLHGEMVAIKNASKALDTFDLSGCEIYTTGEPCPMCLGAIMWANIDKVYYGGTSKDIDSIGFRDDRFYDIINNSKKEFVKELDRDECLKLFEEYKNIADKTNY